MELAERYNRMFEKSVSSGDLETLKLVVEKHDVDIDSVIMCSIAKNARRSALHWAALFEYPAILEYLVLKGANLETTNVVGQTPLIEAVAFGRIESAKTLVKLGAKTNALCKDGKNLLHHAMKAHSPGGYNKEMVDFVRGLDFHDSLDQYNELLLASAEEGDLETTKSLVEQKGVDINYGHNNSALHCAARKGHLEIVEYLMLKGANIEAKDLYGRTPLFDAVKFGQTKVAKILVKLGARTDVESEQGENLLHAAAFSDDIKLISFALDLGFDINQCDTDGRTPLMKSKSEKCAALLLEKGAYYRKYSLSDGWSVLHLAARDESRVPLIKVLLKHVEYCEGKEAMIDFINYNDTNDGKTALHLAVIKRNHLGEELLLERGANPGIKDVFGKVPHDYANDVDSNNESTELMRSFIEAMQRKIADRVSL